MCMNDSQILQCLNVIEMCVLLENFWLLYQGCETVNWMYVWISRDFRQAYKLSVVLVMLQTSGLYTNS